MGTNYQCQLELDHPAQLRIANTIHCRHRYHPKRLNLDKLPFRDDARRQPALAKAFLGT